VAQPIQFQQGTLLHVYVKNMHFNKLIIFKNTKSQALATIRHLQMGNPDCDISERF
jgi:hypothetical protein